MSKSTRLMGDLSTFRIDVKLMSATGREFVTESSGSTAKIILKDVVYVYRSVSLDNRVPLLCRKVANSADRFLKANPDFYHAPVRKVVHFNKSLIKSSMGKYVHGYDINACYWNIAYRDGIISKELYEEGNENKSARLVAIGNLAKVRTTTVYNADGTTTKTSEKYAHSIIWDHILNEVYKMYLDILDITGEDFVAWCTDCVFTIKDYKTDLENYFDSHGLVIKPDPIELVRYDDQKVVFNKLNKNRETYWSLTI